MSIPFEMEVAEVVRHWFGKGCCHGPASETEEGLKKIILVGSPNSGKSVVFGNLTGKYVTVSNYSGTTVEVTRGKGKFGDREFEVTDTPGMYSRGRVACLRTGNSQRLEKLLTLGILPGVEVEMLQRFPSFVFRIGHSQMAVDREMAEGIQIRLKGEKGR